MISCRANTVVCDPCFSKKKAITGARRRCPNCKAALCNNHSKVSSTMKGIEYLNRRNCSNCKQTIHEAAWIAV